MIFLLFTVCNSVQYSYIQSDHMQILTQIQHFGIYTIIHISLQINLLLDESEQLFDEENSAIKKIAALNKTVAYITTTIYLTSNIGNNNKVT